MKNYRLTKIINDINYILLPEVCFGCNTQLYRGEHMLCTVCRNDLPITDYNFVKENAVDRIFYGRILVKKASSFLFFYQDGIIKQLLHHLKYKNQELIGAFLGDLYGQVLKTQDSLAHIDMIIPVPLHPKKQKQRGYNQVTLFGERLSHHLNIPFVPGVLIKTANTKTLTKKNRFSRWQSTKELYQVRDAKFIENKKVLLIDDVITTGATIEACGTSLLKVKGVELYVASMVMVP